MDEKKIRQIAQDVFTQMSKKQEFKVSRVPFHKHNGMDSPQINQKDIERANYFTEKITFTGSATAVISNGISNAKQIQFFGTAHNGSSTIAASIYGSAYLGRTFGLSATRNVDIQATVCQNCVGSRYDTSGPSFSVFDDNILATVNGNDTTIASISVTSWTDKIIVLTGVISAGWVIRGNIIIS